LNASFSGATKGIAACDFKDHYDHCIARALSEAVLKLCPCDPRCRSWQRHGAVAEIIKKEDLLRVSP
jgi:hypothetical protein